MKIKFTEMFVDKLLNSMPKINDVSLKPDFTSSVMDRIRMDSVMAIDNRLSESNDGIFFKFMFATSFVAACAIILAIGVAIPTPITFEEYMVADYMVNVI